MITQWKNKDTTNSTNALWKKLAGALQKTPRYGKATAELFLKAAKMQGNK